MAKPSHGVITSTSLSFTPASDQSIVSHLRVTVQVAADKPDGTLVLAVTSGNVAFAISISDLPVHPEYKRDDRLILEYPKGENPMLADYSAIYHESLKPQQPLVNRSKSMSEKTEIVPFNFEDKTIRVVTDENGEPLFVGKDVCDILGYTNHNKAMNDHCRGVTKRYPILDSLGRTQEARVLVEPDVYRLIVKSELPEAQKFEAWFFEEVLPTIRKTGSYSVKGGNETLHPSVLDQVGAVIQQQLAAMFQAELPRLVQSELARQQISVRCGVTAGQVWQLYKLDTLKNGPQTLSRLLTAFGCEIDGGGKSEQGGRTAKMFDPDKSDKAMKSGLLEHCQRYIRERTGQRTLFAVQQQEKPV